MRTSAQSPSAQSPSAQSLSAQLSLVMPLFNEAAGVEQTVRSLHATLSLVKLPFQLILVDNGSQDQTRAIIEALLPELPGTELLHLPTNQGYGGGILAGMRMAQAPVLGFLWGDSQIAPYTVIRLYEQLTRDHLDMVKATRSVRLDGLQRRAITTLYHQLFPLFFPVHLPDLHGCPKLFTQKAWHQLNADATDWFLDAQLMIRAQRLNLRIGQVEVVCWPRTKGRSKVKAATLVEFAQNLLRYRVQETFWQPRP